MTEESPAVQAAGRAAQHKLIRERATVRIVMGAIAIAVVWWVYGIIQTTRMQSVKWPTLTPVTGGLTVVGLQDIARPGWQPKYLAIQRGYAWIIRRPEDNAGGEPGSAERETPDSPEDQERGSSPVTSKGIAKGEVVEVEEVLEECPTVLTEKHFTGARVEERKEPLFNRSYYIVHVSLAAEARSRYWQFSRDRDDERLVFILKDEIITCPQMKHMDVGTLEIQPIWVKSDATRLADYINAHKQ